MAASASEAGGGKYLAESMRRFCRSIELCDDYLRGYYGLRLVRIFKLRKLGRFFAHYSQTTDRLLNMPPQVRQAKSDIGLPMPSIQIVEKLKETSTAKLSEIVRRSVAGELGWEGYDRAELIAARERRSFFSRILLSRNRPDQDLVILYGCLPSHTTGVHNDKSHELISSLLTEYC